MSTVNSAPPVLPQTSPGPNPSPEFNVTPDLQNTLNAATVSMFNAPNVPLANGTYADTYSNAPTYPTTPVYLASGIQNAPATSGDGVSGSTGGTDSTNSSGAIATNPDGTANTPMAVEQSNGTVNPVIDWNNQPVTPNHHHVTFTPLHAVSLLASYSNWRIMAREAELNGTRMTAIGYAGRRIFRNPSGLPHRVFSGLDARLGHLAQPLKKVGGAVTAPIRADAKMRADPRYIQYVKDEHALRAKIAPGRGPIIQQRERVLGEARHRALNYHTQMDQFRVNGDKAVAEAKGFEAEAQRQLTLHTGTTMEAKWRTDVLKYQQQATDAAAEAAKNIEDCRLRIAAIHDTHGALGVSKGLFFRFAESRAPTAGFKLLRGAGIGLGIAAPLLCAVNAATDLKSMGKIFGDSHSSALKKVLSVGAVACDGLGILGGGLGLTANLGSVALEMERDRTR